MDTEPDASLVGGDVLHLREAFDNDIPLLLQLIRAAFEEYRDKLDPPSGVFMETEQSLRALLTREHAVLATLNGVPVGSTFYDVRQTEFYVHRLAVRQEYRRHGIGADQYLKAPRGRHCGHRGIHRQLEVEEPQLSSSS